MGADDLPRGYRRTRHPAQPAPPEAVQSHRALADAIMGADQLARLQAEASMMAPAPDPEDLLAAWAREYYRSADIWWLYKIGLYVAEDLRLLGKVDGI
jgi:hypothetical protein